MRAYRLHALFVGLFLAGHVLGSAAVRFARPSGEVFPLFSWTLFLRVPNQITEAGIEIVEVDGETFDPPRMYQEAGDRFRRARDITADKLVHSMARAHHQRDERRLGELRAVFEDRFLGGAPGVHYRLVERAYAPLERWHGGPVHEVRRLRDFVSAGATS